VIIRPLSSIKLQDMELN